GRLLGCRGRTGGARGGGAVTGSRGRAAGAPGGARADLAGGGGVHRCGVGGTGHHRVLLHAAGRGEALGETRPHRGTVLLGRAGRLTVGRGHVPRAALAGRGAAHASPPSSPSAGSSVSSGVDATPSASRSALRATAMIRSPLS